MLGDWAHFGGRPMKACDAFTATARYEHRKWDSLHRVRVVVLAVTMIVFLAGIGI